MKKSIIVTLICIALFSCKKDDDDTTPAEQVIPTNLTATLSVESGRIASKEGKPIIINLNLDKAFSEDLILEGAFSIDGITNFTNNDDFKKEFAYSTDLGLSWQKERDLKQVRFEKGKVNLKVKISHFYKQNPFFNDGK